LHWRSLPEDEQNFWWISVPSSLVIIPILLVMLQHFQQCWHGVYTREQKQTRLQMNLQVGKSFVQQLRATMALIQEEQDKHNAQLQNEMESVKEVMKAQERHLTELQNVMDLLKMRIKAGAEQIAQLQNQMGLMEKVMKAEGKGCAQMQEEMQSMKMVVDRWVSVPTEQMVGDPASMERSCQDEDAKKIAHCSFQCCNREKEKIPISKIPVHLVPLINVKPVGSKMGTRDSVCCKPGGGHVKMHTQKLDSSKTQPCTRLGVCCSCL
jgi:hypothetical protein